VGIGLLITVIILGTLLGLFSRQALQSVDKQPVQNSHKELETTQDKESSQPHPHAI
jgi:hypothetical protein